MTYLRTSLLRNHVSFSKRTLRPSLSLVCPFPFSFLQPKNIRSKNHAFIKHCLLPRLVRSMADAVYCHYFCLKLHELNVPNWPAGFFWDEVGCLVDTLTSTAHGNLRGVGVELCLHHVLWSRDTSLVMSEMLEPLLHCTILNSHKHPTDTL